MTWSYDKTSKLIRASLTSAPKVAGRSRSYHKSSNRPPPKFLINAIENGWFLSGGIALRPLLNKTVNNQNSNGT